MILSRNLLHPNLTFDRKSRDEICDMIDYWKVLLWENYNMRPGDRIGIIFTIPDPYYLSMLFASFELGLTVVLTSHPRGVNNNEGLKQSLYDNLKLALYDDWNADVAHVHAEFFDTVEHANIFDTYEIKDHSLYDTVAKKIFATPDTVAILTTSSGSTGTPKIIPKSHEFYYVSSERQVRLLNYAEDDRVVHTRQISHGGAFDIFWLPTLMACATHMVHVYEDNSLEAVQKLCKDIVDYKITRFWAIDTTIIDYVLKTLPVLEHDFNMFHINYIQPHWPKLAKDKNLKSFINSYGTIEIGSSVLLNVLDRDTDLDTYKSNKFKMLDDWYEFTCNEYDCTITNKYTGETMAFNDQWVPDGDGYLFLGRSDSYKVNEVVFTEKQIQTAVKTIIDQPFELIIDQEFQKIYIGMYNEFDDTLKDQLDRVIQDRIDPRLSISRIGMVSPEQFLQGFKIDKFMLRKYFQTLD